MVQRPGLYSLIGLIVVGGLGAQLCQSAAALPARRSGARQGAGRAGQRSARRQADRRQPDRRADRIPRRARRSTRRRRSTSIARGSCRRRGQAGVGNVWSLETLRRWLAEKLGKTDVATLQEYVDAAARRIWCGDSSPPTEDAVVVSGRVPDKDASELLADRQARSTKRWTPCARAIPAIKSRSPDSRRSRRATAPT